MKITDVRAAILEEGLGGDWVLVQVRTDEGIVGLGETFPTMAFQGQVLKDVILSTKSFLLGEDPTNVDRLTLKMFQQLGRTGSIAGAVTTAISGIEIALWDVAGKAAGLPVYKLLGGKHRDKIRVYSDFDHRVGPDNPEEFARIAADVVSQGFTAVKMDIDFPRWRGEESGHYRAARNDEIRHLARLVEGVRSAIGDDVDLAVDCHGAFDTVSAKRIAYALEDYELLWLEDPVPPRNVAAMAEVKASTRTPICTGENLYTRFQFRELLERQAADIIEPDVQKAGGILESRRIADLASTHYMLMAPHCVSTPVGTMASVHLCASIVNFLMLEYHQIDFPWWQDLALIEELIVQNGYIRVPEKPGLGIELNEAEVVKRLRPGESLFGD